MLLVPANIPVTTPDDAPIFALPLLLVHVPPVGVEFNVVVNPAHTVVIPVIVVGLALTLTVVILIQPVPSV